MEDAVRADPSLTVEQLRVAWGAPCLGRLIQPVEVGRVVAFLSSDAATIIRGQGITVDAGATPVLMAAGIISASGISADGGKPGLRARLLSHFLPKQESCMKTAIF